MKNKKKPSSSHRGKSEDEGLSKTLTSVSANKIRSRNIVKYLPPETEGKAIHDVCTCYAWGEMAHFPLEGKQKLKRAVTCKRPRLCINCAHRMGGKMYHGLRSKIEQLQGQPKDFFLVTLTVKGSSDLNETMGRLRKAFKGLVDGRRWYLSRAKSKTKQLDIETHPWAVMDGWFGHIETTNKKGLWHPHIHLIVKPNDASLHYFANKKMPNEFTEKGHWKSEIQAMLGRFLHKMDGQSYIVDVRRLNDLEGSLAEVCKYSFKPSEMSDSQIAEHYMATKRKRLTFSGGCFRGLSKEVVPAESELDAADEKKPYISFFFKWLDEQERFSLKAQSVHPGTDTKEEDKAAVKAALMSQAEQIERNWS